jgi:hypothetical protein
VPLFAILFWELEPFCYFRISSKANVISVVFYFPHHSDTGRLRVKPTRAVILLNGYAEEKPRSEVYTLQPAGHLPKFCNGTPTPNAMKRHKAMHTISTLNLCGWQSTLPPPHTHIPRRLHRAINSRLNTASQPSNGSNTSQCTVSSHLCLASSKVGGGGAVRDGRTNVGMMPSAACVAHISNGCSETK